MNANATTKFFALVATTAFGIGCASMQPLSSYARTGDTVAVALGGTDSHALSSVVKEENVTATITDFNGSAFPVKVRRVFRILSDPTSIFRYRNDTGGGYYEQYVSEHQGEWIAIVDLKDPVTGEKPMLAVGNAVLSIASPDLAPRVNIQGTTAWGGDLENIPIEILPGTGKANSLNYLSPISYHPIESLSPCPQVEVRTSGTPSKPIGGASFVFSYVNDNFFSPLRVATTSPDQNVQLLSNRVPQGNGTTLLYVLIANPHGFKVDNQRNVLDPETSLNKDLRFSVVWDPWSTSVTDDNWQNSLQVVSAEYVDLDGNPMPELTYTLTKVR